MFRISFAGLVAAMALTAAPALATELVVNGDFSAGVSGFTTDYVIAPAHSDALGDLYLTTNANFICGCFASRTDHTTGTGNLLVFDGAENAGVEFWRQTISVVANSDYNLSFWLANLGASGPTPSISARIDGIEVAASGGLPYDNAWRQFGTTFNSGASTSLVLSFVDTANTHQYNDFAFDDVSVRGAAAVPEPAVWTLMLAGFGLAGTAVRGRRSQLAQA